jgi:periplasmic protein TonB
MMKRFLLSAVAAQIVLVTPAHAEKSQGSWQTNGDYPAKALREGREGTVFYTLLVGADGKGKKCTVTTSSGHSDLDEAACNSVMKRATFAPARDENGNPVDGELKSKTVFKLP